MIKMNELTAEGKKSLLEIFEEYQNNIRKKKTLSADNRDAVADFAELNSDGKDYGYKKTLKKEISKYFRAKTEVSEGGDPVEQVVKVRKDHFNLTPDQKERLDEMWRVKMRDQVEKDELTDQNEELIGRARIICQTSFDIMKGAFNDVVRYYNGKEILSSEIYEAFEFMLAVNKKEEAAS